MDPLLALLIALRIDCIFTLCWAQAKYVALAFTVKKVTTFCLEAGDFVEVWRAFVISRALHACVEERNIYTGIERVEASILIHCNSLKGA